jgi:hypothetical protein
LKVIPTLDFLRTNKSITFLVSLLILQNKVNKITLFPKHIQKEEKAEGNFTSLKLKNNWISRVVIFLESGEPRVEGRLHPLLASKKCLKLLACSTSSLEETERMILQNYEVFYSAFVLASDREVQLASRSSVIAKVCLVRCEVQIAGTSW